MPPLRLSRAPRTDDELHLLIKAMFGVDLPRKGICEGHSSPFSAVAHAYFAREPNFAVWYASRGSGKSLALAVLGLVKAFVADADVTILGGSSWQSANVRAHMSKMLKYPNAPTYAVSRDIATVIETSTGKQIQPLPASQTSVRGPHPPLQLLDEIDEMEYSIYEAALGQAMEQLNTRGEIVGEYIVASSTWQNPIGCVLAGTFIITQRGELPIERVQVGDLVPTRAGWRVVTHTHNTGQQECVTVSFASGRQLTCTPWHPIWTTGGFVRADALAAGTLTLSIASSYPVSFSGSEPVVSASMAGQASPPLLAGSGRVVVPEEGVGFREVVSSGAHGRSRTAPAGAGDVDLLRDGLQVPRVDTEPVRAGDAATAAEVGVVAEMVQSQSIRDRADQLFIDPPMRKPGSSDRAVASALFATRPDDAVVSVLEDQPRQLGHAVDESFTYDQVVHVAQHGMVLPTYDLTVAGEPEYVANGILVHNTMTTVIEDARDKGLPVFTWCWRELLEENGGWMSQRFIDAKKRTVSASMWKTEYELNEPVSSSRAFDLDKIEQYFVEYDEPVSERHELHDDTWIWAKPDPLGVYAAGADWAKEIDMTVLVVLRVDCNPRRVVALRRMNRQSYEVMTNAFTKLVRDYNNAESLHDKTGVGNGLNDFLGEDARAGYVLVGRKRSQIFSNYIADFEHGGYLLPKKISEKDPFHRAHRGATVADVFAPAQWNEHTPDDVVAMALAHHAAGRSPIPGDLPEMPKDLTPRKVDRQFHVQPTTERTEGLVSVVDDSWGDDMMDAMSVGMRADSSDVSGWLS